MLPNQFKEILTRFECFYSRSEEDMFKEYSPLAAEIAVTKDPVPWKDRESLVYRPLQEGECWGKDWDSCWVHVRGTVPASWAGQQLVMRLNLGGEALVFDEAGVPVCGLTDHSLFDRYFVKEIYYFAQPAQPNQEVDLWIEGVSSNIQGKTDFPWAPHVSREPHPEGQSHPVVKSLRLAVFRDELYHYRIEFDFLYSLLKEYYKADCTKHRARQLAYALYKSLDAYCGKPDNAAAARAVLAPVLRLPACGSALKCTATGHAHIDVGWLWPVKESIRKVARTFSSQLRLMEQFPEYHFGESQPQLYLFCKEYYPALYEQIKKRVQEGRWECEGGMWVEADNNLPSGESLIRQFLHGKNFFMDEFGVEAKDLWMPDVFGYNGNTPQIMKICGCDYFLTMKLAWNAINKPVYSTFRWQGIDGTQVFAHMPPEDNNYNSSLGGGAMAQNQDKLKESAICPEFVMPYGIGDGGGGPCRDHVERALLMKDQEDFPHLTMGNAQDTLEHMAECWDELPVWQGELYFEKHRGTLTSQARTKRANRQLEQKLLQTEALCSLLPPEEYPRKELDKIVKTILINQFHDIIPGSSIRLVYENTAKEHAQCLEALDELQKKAASRLMARQENALVLFNSLSVPYRRPVELPKEWSTGAIATAQGVPVPVQVESDERVFASVEIPADGFLVLCRDPKGATSAVPTVRDRDVLALENDALFCAFDADGHLTECRAKQSGRQWLRGAGNVLRIYQDEAAEYDAWDVDPWYRNQVVDEAKAVQGESALREVGPVRGVLKFSLAIGESSIEQEVSLAAGGDTLEFRNAVEWHEGRKLLRVAFPTPVESPWATYDIQYGQVRRPTHTNTSWDSAQFEVCAQRYADLSTEEGGLAILNDCKYGHCIRDGVLSLSLLRAPKWPDYTADLGHQEFTYAICPHEKGLDDSDVIAQAAQLNRAPALFVDRAAPAAQLPFFLEGQGVSLEVVKRGEKCDELFLRIVETRGRHAEALLRLREGAQATRVLVTDAIEWNTLEEPARDASGAFRLALHPYQILTLKLAR